LTHTTPPPIGELLDQVLSLRNAVLSARDELAQTELVGEAGNGLVSVTVRGTGEVIGVRLHPDVKRQALHDLEDLFLVAAAQAQDTARVLAEQRSKQFEHDIR
jgi:nucleoid-associated protein EbfC